MKNGFTVTVPVYNMGKFLDRNLSNLVSQKESVDNFKIIVVDDCSSDNSIEVVRRYSDKLDIDILELKDRTGTGEARNKALKMCKTEFVGFLDADDLMNLGVADECITKMKETGCDFGQCSAYKYSIRDNKIMGKKSFGEVLDILGETVIDVNSCKDSLFEYISSNCWAKICRVEHLRKNNIVFPDCKYEEDTAFSLKLAIHSNKIYWLDKPLITYTHPYFNGNSNNKKSVDTWKDLFIALNDVLKEIMRIDDKEKRNKLLDSLVLSAIDDIEYTYRNISERDKYIYKEVTGDFMIQLRQSRLEK